MRHIAVTHEARAHLAPLGQPGRRGGPALRWPDGLAPGGQPVDSSGQETALLDIIIGYYRC